MYDRLLFHKMKLNSLILPVMLIGTGISVLAGAGHQALASTAPSRVVDDTPHLPDTPAGEGMRELIPLLQSESDAAFKRFIDRYDPNSTKAERVGWKDHIETMRMLMGADVRFNDVLWSEPRNIGVRVSSAGATRWFKVLLELTDADPPGLSKMSLRKATAPDSADTAQLTATQQAAIVESVAKELRAGYIIDGMGEKLAECIESNLKANIYQSITSPRLFAARVTEDLWSVNSDKHLAIFPPEQLLVPPTAPARAPRGGPELELDEQPEGLELKEHEDGPDLDEHPQLEERPQLEQHGPANRGGDESFTVELLRDDTIGLVSFTSMYTNDDEAEARVAALMESLTGVETIIFDFRETNGGDPSFIMALLSYFFEKPTHVSTHATKWPPDYELTLSEVWTTPNERSQEFASVPIFILISPRTASGPESFTSKLRDQNRATLVGERTAGAGHLATNVNVAEGFVLKLPIGRGIDPKTGEGNGFEGIGIVPDIEVPAEQALDSALELIEKE